MRTYKSPITKSLSDAVLYIESEGTKLCNEIARYAKKWKQHINVEKTVGQVFYSQVKIPRVKISMNGQPIEMVNTFKYLGYTWTSKLSWKLTIEHCLEKVNLGIRKLNWLNKGRKITS